MLIVFIKYFFMILCSFYFYSKVLHLEITCLMNIKVILCALFMSIPIYFLQNYTPYLTVTFMVVVFCLIAKCNYHTSLELSFVTSVITFAFSYFAFLLSALLISPLLFFIMKSTKDTNLFFILTHILLGTIQFIISAIPFRFQRLKNGMPFLLQKSSNSMGVSISILVLAATSCYGTYKENYSLFAILLINIAIFGVILLIWWQKQLTRIYLEKLRTKEVSTLEAEVEKLKNENERLSKIIHKDNKLIPAMELAVRDMLMSFHTNETKEFQIQKAADLLHGLENLSKERTGVLSTYEEENIPLPQTNIARLDALLRYMKQKASSYHIHLEFIQNANIKYMLEHIISEDDFTTLLADLTENAIIATKEQTTKNILINIGIKDQSSYYLEVYDSGIPFEADTISKLGTVRTTTHADSGGSGIGMMTTFEMLRRYHASFYIDEQLHNTLYFKKVAVIFDNQQEIHMKQQ